MKFFEEIAKAKKECCGEPYKKDGKVEVCSKDKLCPSCANKNIGKKVNVKA
jgi:hypothetical protein